MKEASVQDFRTDTALIEWQKHYRVDDEPVARAFGVNLSPRHSDLVDIAMCVYVADRRLRRRAPDGARDSFGFCWSRRIPLLVPVRDLTFWNNAGVQDQLVEFLRWLTDDHWEVKFSPRSTPRRAAEDQTHLFSSPVSKPAACALFSGGLDSLAGAARDLNDPSLSELVLVTVRTSPQMGAAQRHLLQELSRASAGRIRSVVVPLGLVRAPDPNRQEPSQRSRGFAFLAAGFVTAAAAGLDELRVYENGIGAINLPYSASQVGTRSARGAHPRTLEGAAALFSLVRDAPFRIAGAHMDQTKAALCADIPPHYRDLVPRTFTCDTAFTQRISGVTACGACSSCLLRRQALWAAGMREVDALTGHRWDLFGGADIDPVHSYTLHAMLAQAARLRDCLAAPNPWAALVHEFPAILSVPGIRDENGLTRKRVLSLFGSYVQEWERVPLETVRRYLSNKEAQTVARI